MSYFTEKEIKYKLKALIEAGFSNKQAAVTFAIIEEVADTLDKELENLQKEITNNEKQIEALEARLDNV